MLEGNENLELSIHLKVWYNNFNRPELIWQRSMPMKGGVNS